MDFLPLFHNLKDRNVLVVGGGEVALRKVRLVHQAGARITVVAKDFCPDLVELASEAGSIAKLGPNLIATAYHQEQMETLTPIVLVIAATNDRELNHQVSADAQALNILSNVVDDPEYSTAIFPSIVDRSPIQIAISSGGSAPVLVRRIRTQLEGLIPSGMSRLGALAGSYRDKVKAKFSSGLDRKAFWESVFDGPVAEQAYANNMDEATRLLEDSVNSFSTIDIGEIYLIGGGPGDPDLLTFKAVRLMQQADVVYYDHRVSNDVLELVRRDASRIFVGKSSSGTATNQDNVAQKMIESALERNRVVRLVGGDPFTFDHASEEIDTLLEHNISFQVVPGIPAATACAAYAGIPLTDSRFSQTVQFLDAHPRSGQLNLDWSSLSRANQTLVFYRAIAVIDIICKELISHGLDAHTPAALVERGVYADQRVIVGDLTDLSAKVGQAGIKPPTIVIIGETVWQRDQLAWFR